jgi:uncharacterized membrane protein YeaQ/YmgE (transglycosylase-associated protein family)
MRRSDQMAVAISAGVAGAVGSVVAVATDLSPVPTGSLAGLLSALLGAATVTVTVRLLGESD